MAHEVRTAEDWQRVTEALQSMQLTGMIRGTKKMHQIADWRKVLATMQDYGHLWLVDGYLVYFDINPPWYSDQVILTELLIVRVEAGGTFNSVTRFLREQARAAGAAYVAVGTSFALSDRALARLYQAEGFTPEATMLTMDPL